MINHLTGVGRMVVLAAAVLAVVPATVAAATDAPTTHVIVRQQAGAGPAAERMVRDLGGTIGRRIGLIDAFTAVVPARAVAAIAASGSVASITPDAHVQMLGLMDGVDEGDDLGSPLHTRRAVGADDYWAAGYTGEGVDVALIDSGVTPVEGLDGDGKVINGPDLSFESQVDSTATSTRTATGRTWPASSPAAIRAPTPSRRDDTHFLGIAPGSRIISLKVADARAAPTCPRSSRPSTGSSSTATPGRPAHPRPEPLVRHRQPAELHGRPAGVRGRGRLARRHLRGRRRRQPGVPRDRQRRQHRRRHAQRPGLRPARAGRGSRRQRRHRSHLGRHGRGVLQPGRQRAAPGRDHAGPLDRQPARPGLVHRPVVPRRPGRRPLLPRQRHEPVRGGRLRCAPRWSSSSGRGSRRTSSRRCSWAPPRSSSTPTGMPRAGDSCHLAAL